jgi:hypothetical protein
MDSTLATGLLSSFCLVPLVFFLITIFFWRWLGMWFTGMRELIKEIRGLRQDLVTLRGFTAQPYQQPGMPSTPALPATPRPSMPSTYTPPVTPTFNPQQMSSTPPPGWSGPWDPSQWGVQK